MLDNAAVRVGIRVGLDCAVKPSLRLEISVSAHFFQYLKNLG